MFQCSSASRKFLNLSVRRETGAGKCVSVLFSEPKIPQGNEESDNENGHLLVSVLFSEPKIPQCLASSWYPSKLGVSVLFSEPKIPQIPLETDVGLTTVMVSVLFSEPKIPQTV